MGEGIRVKCDNCCFEKLFFLGVGWAFDSLKNVIDAVGEKRKNEILEILNTHDVQKHSFYNALFVCPNCKSLHQRLYVEIVYDNDKKYQTIYICRSCERTLESVQDLSIIENLPCPRCKNKLSFEGGIMWD